MVMSWPTKYFAFNIIWIQRETRLHRFSFDNHIIHVNTSRFFSKIRERETEYSKL